MKTMKSSEYWRKRAEQVANNHFEMTDKYILGLQLEYLEAQTSIQKDIDVFYSRFAANNSITLDEARKLLNSGQLREFQMTLKEFTKKAKDNENGQWEKELNNVSFKVRVSRLQALQLQVRNHIEDLYSSQQKGTTGLLTNVYKDTYYRTIYEVAKGIGTVTSFAKIDDKALKTILNTPWLGENFSSRIWNNKEKLVMELQTNLTQAFIRGDSIEKTSGMIADRMGVSKRRATTLVNTESANIASRATMNGYAESGIVKQYEILATLDLRTSEICRSMDGKIFNVTERQIGVNAPPFHVNCRTTTIPYFDDAVDEKRIARDENEKSYYVDGNINYEQWKDKYVSSDIKQSSVKQAKKNDKKIDITDVAINKVPYVELPGFTSEQNTLLQNKHKELLEIARDKNDSNEVLNILTTEFDKEALTLGNETEVKPGENPEAVSLMRRAQENSVVWIHNHPKNSTFSYGDLFSFLQPQIKALTAVTNQGKVFSISKNNNFNYFGLYGMIKEILMSYGGKVNTENHDAIMKDILKEISNYGVNYIK
jgi:SPP1 gp7 family putative phage head morphogenesis protein